MTDPKDAMHSANIAEGVSMAPDLGSLSEVLLKMVASEVVTSERLRIVLKHRATDIITIARQSRLEGRTLLEMHWIVSYPEFLLENTVQEEIRNSGLGGDILHDFANVLDAEGRSIIEYKEVLRSLGTIPGIADVAWEELHRSPLKGLATAIESEEGIVRLLALVLKIGTLLYNESILQAVNSRADEIVVALEKRKNPDLARNMMGALALLPSSPWQFDNLDTPARGALDSQIIDSVLLRTIKNIPEVQEMVETLLGSQKKFRILVERTIDRLGWPFVRSYMLHIAEQFQENIPWLYKLANTMQPLGGINNAFLLNSLFQDLPVPRQIIQGALGTPDEYILSFDALEQENLVRGFKSDGIELESSIEAKKIEAHHLENARTGIRLDESIRGKSSLIRKLVEMKSDQATEIASDFLKGLVVSPYQPIRMKKTASRWLRTLGKT